MATPSDSPLFMVDECKILPSTCKPSFQFSHTNGNSHERTTMAQTR